MHLTDLPRIDRKVLFGAGFLVFSVVVLILVARMVRPFLDALLWAAVLAILAYPVNKLVLRLTRRRRTLAAALTTALVAVIMLGVTAFLARSLLQESKQAYQGFMQSFGGSGSKVITERIARLPADLFPGLLNKEAVAALRGWLDSLGTSALAALNQNMTKWINAAIGNASRFLLDLFVTVVSVFFLLRQGEGWVLAAKESVPLAPRLREIIIDRFTVTFRAIVYGVLFGAVIEAVLMTLGFYFFGVPLPIFFGVVTFFVVLVPFIGPPAIWIPTTLYLWLIAGDAMQAVGFALYGGLVVVALGSLVKPAIIGTQAKLPIFFVFLAILGGLMAFGAVGIILGPILLAIAIAMAGIYRELAASRTA